MKFVTFLIIGLSLINFGDAKLHKRRNKFGPLVDLVPLSPEEQEAYSFLGEMHYFDEYLLGFLHSFSDKITIESKSFLEEMYNKPECNRETIQQTLHTFTKDKDQKVNPYQQYYIDIVKDVNTVEGRLQKCMSVVHVNQKMLDQKNAELKDRKDNREAKIDQAVDVLKEIEKEIEQLKNEYNKALDDIEKIIVKRMKKKEKEEEKRPDIIKDAKLNLSTSKEMKTYIDSYFSFGNSNDGEQKKLIQYENIVQNKKQKIKEKYFQYTATLNSLNKLKETKKIEDALEKEIEDIENKLTINCKRFAADPENEGFDDYGYKGVIKSKNFINKVFICANSIPGIEDIITKGREFIKDKQKFVIEELTNLIDTYGDSLLQFISRKLIKSTVEGAKYLFQFKNLRKCKKNRDYKCLAYEKGRQLGYSTRALFSLAFE